jgi:acetyltransferase-like isoleucine patch superfamily enzyme
MQYISIGDRVIVKEEGWIEANPLDNNCLLSIGTGTSIGYFCHIYAMQKVEIGANVLMGSGVYIADCTHDYQDISRPIIAQSPRFVAPVSIGAGSWIGQHAVVLGTRVGKHCVVGANSVVTADVPDHCVVAGSPAQIIRQYDPVTEKWINKR